MKMGYSRMLETLFILCGIITVGSAIMCSVCDSSKDLHCSTHPPPPVNCTHCTLYKNDTAKTCLQYAYYEHCLTVEKFDENSTLLSFVRSCSPPLAKGETYYCVPTTENKRMCFYFCETDGCNHGQTVKGHQWSIAIGSVLLAQWIFAYL